MKKHILVVSQYFYPEQFRINDICIEWIKRGYKVTVLTGIPNYPEGKFYKGYGLFKKRKENYKGINIIRIPIIQRRNNPISLSLNYLSFVVSGFFWKCFTRIKADYVFNFEVSPMTQALVGVWYAKKRKIPCYLYLTDLWPDNIEIVTNIKNKSFYNIIENMVNYIYQESDKIFTSSKSFATTIVKRGVPKNKVEFWPQYAEQFYKPFKDEVHISKIDKNKFNILFAGNIGFAQGLDILPKVAQKLEKKQISDVCFNIVGNGRFKNNLIELVYNQKLNSYFNFFDRHQGCDIPKFMKVCDVALICLSKSKVFSITLPAKTQSCLACGIPILVSADGEIQQIVKKSNSGFFSDAEDVLGLLNNLLKMKKKSKQELEILGENALEFSKNNFEKKILLDQMDKYFT